MSERPEMWWGRTEVNWSWDENPYDVWFDDSEILVSKVLAEPYFNRHYWRITSIGILAQFFLGKDRQPTEEPKLFASYPRLKVNGRINAWAAPLLSRDYGDAEFSIRLHQSSKLDGEHHKVGNEDIFWVEGTAGGTERTLTSLDPLRFPTLNLWLGGPEAKDLLIELHVTIRFLIRRLAQIEFEPLTGRPAISLRLPQWDLVDVADTL